jgi:hypothetical protein
MKRESVEEILRCPDWCLCQCHQTMCGCHDGGLSKVLP